MEQVRKMAEMTWPEFSELLNETDLALVPVGTVEEHGHHLPLGTDVFGAEGVAERIGEKVKCIILPAVPYGNNIECWNTSEWPGSISISTETLANLYREIGEEMVRFGAKRILFVSGHFNLIGPLRTAAFRIWKKTGAAVGIHEYYIAAADIATKYTECIHADQVETSMILIGSKAHLIKLDRAIPTVNPFPPVEDERELWERNVFANYTYMADEKYLHAGNLGDPRKASKEIGEDVMATAVNVAIKMAEVLKKHVNEKKLERYRQSIQEF
jgi:creatinine amidohydrolase